MITNLTGSILKTGEDFVIVQVGGVGLKVSVPTSVLQQADGPGRPITLHTSFQVRENGISLYGFGSEDDRDLFELLLGVSGIGPRLALNVLSTLSPDVLAGAVAREEPAVLQRVPGVGKKTAERIVFHLRDKLAIDRGPAGISMLSDVDAEIIAALTTLGYSIVEAQAALQRLPGDAPAELDERLRLVLSMLGG
jgi:Holliday junction DNA helicase RuvA